MDMRDVLFCLAAALPTLVSAQSATTKDVDKAQIEMSHRVSATVKTYAARIGIEPWYVSYCKNNMKLETSLYPTNGLVPFGVDYKGITDVKTLDLVISNREAFETGYIQLCLAEAKNILKTASE